jgi:opacity protein-like surface antigen
VIGRLLVAAFCLAPSAALGQGTPPPRLQIGLGGGLLSSTAYFTGPGNLALDNSDAFAGMLQVIAPVHRSLAIVVSGAYARPAWRLSGVPLLGSVGVDGASLWFADASLRGQLPLGGRSSAGPTAFAQAGPGLAHYGVSTSVLGRAVDAGATNLALALGAGLEVPVTTRFGLELLAKDYVVSFKSVRDLAALGVEGRRTHTLVLAVSGRMRL